MKSENCATILECNYQAHHFPFFYAEVTGEVTIGLLLLSETTLRGHTLVVVSQQQKEGEDEICKLPV